MTYKTHVAFALLPSIAMQTQLLEFSKDFAIIFYIAVAIGALLPDLDEEGSYLSKKIPIIPLFLKLLGVEHRGITHRLIFVVALVAITLFMVDTYPDGITKSFFYGITFGYFMHIMGDMLTKGGINNIFYPFSSVRGVLLPRFLRFYTGSFTEYLVLSAIVVLIILEILVLGVF